MNTQDILQDDESAKEYLLSHGIMPQEELMVVVNHLIPVFDEWQTTELSPLGTDPETYDYWLKESLQFPDSTVLALACAIRP